MLCVMVCVIYDVIQKYYMSLHEILHDHSNDYIKLQNLEVRHVMACNFHVSIG